MRTVRLGGMSTPCRLCRCVHVRSSSATPALPASASPLAGAGARGHSLQYAEVLLPACLLCERAKQCGGSPPHHCLKSRPLPHERRCW